MAEESVGYSLITPQFIMSYPNLAEPKAYKDPKTGHEKGDKHFSVSMVITPENLNRFQQWSDESEGFVDVSLPKVFYGIAKQMWPSINVKEARAAGGLLWPIKNALEDAERRAQEKGRPLDEKIRSAMEGNAVVNADTLEKFTCPLYYTESDGSIKSIPRETREGASKIQRMFVGGHYAFAEVRATGGVSGTVKYVKLYLKSVTFVREGVRFGEGNLMDRLRGTKGGQTDYDPTEGMSDDLDDMPDF